MEHYAVFTDGSAILNRFTAPPDPAVQKLQEEAAARLRGFAVDSAPDEDNWEAVLTAAYGRLLRGGNADIDENFSGITPLSDDFERRAAETRTRAAEVHADLANDAVQEAKRFEEFRAARGWDGSSEATLRVNFDLERLYQNRLHETQPLASSTDAKGGF